MHNGVRIQNVHNIGTLKDHINMPTKTKLSKSPLYNKIEGAKPMCAPAVLFDPLDDPLTKGLSKVANITEPIDMELLLKCSDHFFNGEFIRDNAQARILSYEEGIVGNKDMGVVPLSRSTSPGYPYTHQKKTKLAGKKEWFGETDYVINTEVKVTVEERIAKARLGQRSETLWIDTLKDERRPIEKVQANKTRVFSVGPQDYIISVRMLFGAFVGHVMKNRIKNEVCVGVNCYSNEWTHLAHRLREVGTKYIAGDFSNFDGSLLLEILRAICDGINKWYDDDEQLTRTVLFEEICNGVHVCRDHVYSWTHSQPSGNPMTVIINSIFNSIVMRMAFVKLGGSLLEYDKHVRMANYGDDNLFCVSDEMINQFNQLTITQALSEIGLAYTDEGKTGNIVPYRDLSEVAFLKRNFRRISGGIYRSPLSLATITEMCQWLRSSADPIGDCIVNVEQALFELSLHDDLTWNIWYPRIVKACRENGISINTYAQLDVYNDRIQQYVDVDAEFQGNFKELHTKDLTGEEQVLQISRNVATQVSEVACLSGRTSLAAPIKSSCSPGRNIAVFPISSKSANKQIEIKRKFKPLTEGTKVKQYYNDVTKECTILVHKDGKRVFRKTKILQNHENKHIMFKDMYQRYVKKEENAKFGRIPKRNQRDAKNWLAGTISGDDKTKKVVQRVILESNFAISTDFVKSCVTSYLQMNLPPIVNSTWRSVLAGYVIANLPDVVVIAGIEMTKNDVLALMQQGKMEPWDAMLLPYTTSRVQLILQYIFYIGTAIVEESIISTDRKLLYGVYELITRMKQDSSRVKDYLPAFIMHVITAGFGGYGVGARILFHACFNAYTVFARNWMCGTLENEQPDNASIMATEKGSVSQTEGDSDMTQLVQDQDKIEDNSIQKSSLTTAKNDLAQTLQRKILVSKFALNQTDTVLMPKYNKVFPAEIFNKSQFMVARLQNYRYIRGSMKFTLMINATKFDIGQLYMLWIPNANTDNSGTFDNYHWRSLRGVTAGIGVPLKVGPGAVGELTVPYLMPYKGFDLHPHEYSCGVLKVFVLNPLKSGSENPIQCTLYAQFCEDVQVEVAMPLQDAARHQIGMLSDYSVGCGIRSGTLTESIAGAIDIATSIGSVLVGGIPIVSEVAGSISKVMGLFGWAKPVNIDVVHQFSQAPAKEFNHARGMDNSTVLGLESSNCSDLTQNYCYRPYDEMSFEYLFRQRCLMHTVEWDYSSPTILHTHQVVPWSPETTTNGSDLEFADVDYLGYIANMFDLWTGEIEITIEILNHMAQSGRIRVGIFPPISDSVAAALTLEDFDNVPNEVMDIQANQSTLTFNAPYLLPTAWSNVNTPGCTVVIAVMNELVYQGGTPGTAYINMWRRGTKNLQFTSPNQQTSYMPQWRDGVLSSKPEFQYFVEEEMTTTFHEFQTPAGVADSSVDTFKSVKDLINRPSLMMINKTNTDVAFSVNENVFGSLKDSYSSDDLFTYNSERPSALEYFSRLFAFCRGSINEKAVAQKNDGVVYSNVATIPVVSGSSVSPDSFFDPYLSYSNMELEAQRFTAIHPLSINPIAEVNIPQFSHTPMRAVQYVGHTDNRIPLGGALANSTEIRHFQWIFPSSNTEPFYLYRGGGDDFQFSALFGVPRLCRIVSE